MENKEIILCSSIWYKDLKPLVDRIPPEYYLPKNITKGLVFCGHRHYQCLLLKSAMTNLRDAECGDFIQGFLTSSNRFVDREEAYKIAEKNMQLTKHKTRKELYSEDLY